MISRFVAEGAGPSVVAYLDISDCVMISWLSPRRVAFGAAFGRSRLVIAVLRRCAKDTFSLQDLVRGPTAQEDKARPGVRQMG